MGLRQHAKDAWLSLKEANVGEAILTVLAWEDGAEYGHAVGPTASGGADLGEVARKAALRFGNAAVIKWEDRGQSIATIVREYGHRTHEHPHGVPRRMYAVTYTSKLGEEEYLEASSLPELQRKLAESYYHGPSLRVTDDAGLAVGWVSATEWRYA